MNGSLCGCTAPCLPFASDVWSPVWHLPAASWKVLCCSGLLAEPGQTVLCTLLMDPQISALILLYLRDTRLSPFTLTEPSYLRPKRSQAEM